MLRATNTSNVFPGIRSGNDHVLPGRSQRETNYYVPSQSPFDYMSGSYRPPIHIGHPTISVDRRFEHVQTNSRSFSTNVRFGMREAGYIPLVGTIVGICRFVYGILCILHLTALPPSLGYRYCGRGLVEMIPVVGGISLYYYDRR